MTDQESSSTPTAGSFTDTTQHIDQSIPIEWHAMEYGGQTFVVRDVPEGTAEMYVVEGSSRNLRTLARANAVIYEGSVVMTHYDHDSRKVLFVHDWAGTMGRHLVDEWLEEPAVVLEKVPSGSPRMVYEREEKA